MIGKIIADGTRLTKLLGGTTNAEMVHITTEVNDKQLKKLKEEILKCNTTVEIDTVVKEQGLDKIEGLSAYLKELYSTGNLKNLSIDDVNKFAINQRYNDIAKQAHGFKGVKQAIDEYNKGIEEGTLNTDKFISTISSSNTNLGKYLTGLNGAEAEITDYGKSLLTATAKTFALQAATMAMNAAISMGISFLVSAAISAIASWADNIIHATEKAKEELEEANSNLEEINSELETTASRIDELNAKQNLSLVEAEELEKLKATNDELERELRIRKDLAKTKGEKANKEALLYFNSTYGDNFAESFWAQLKADIKSGAIFRAGTLDAPPYFTDKIAEAEYNIETLEALKQKLKELTDTKSREYKSTLAAIQDMESTLADTILDFMENDDLLIEGQDKGLLDRLDSLYEKYDIYTNGRGSVIEEKISGILGKVDFSEQKEQLLELGKNGEISIDTLTSKFPELIDYLNAAGISAEELYQYIMALSNPDAINYDEIRKQLLETVGIRDGIIGGASDERKWNQLNDIGLLETDALEAFISVKAKFTDSETEYWTIDDWIAHIQDELNKSDFSVSETDNLFSYDKLEDIPQKLSEIESAYQTAQEALDSFNEKGYYSMDVIDSILSLEDEYINILVDENGQLQINSDSMNQLAEIKIEAAKASIYQETCEELVRIKTLDTSLAAQELALVNGTLTESAYETAKALYEEVTAMGGANAALADNVWNAATKKVKLLDNQLANIQGKTYSVDVSLKATSSSSSSTSSDPLKDAFTQEYNTLKHNLEMDYITEKQYYDSLAALNKKYFAGKEDYLDEYLQYEEEVYKGLKSYYTDYAESQMDLLESQLDAGIINYAHYSSTIKSLLDNMYSDSGLSAEDYHKYIQQMLNKQLDIYNKVLSAVTSRIEKEIDGIEDIIDSIEKQNDTLENQLDNYDSILSVIASVYEAEIDRIKAEQDAIQENIDALQDENDQRELALKLEEARWALYKAQNQRTKKIFNGTEFIYETDQAAVREAQETLADLELEQVVDELEREKDALDDTISELEKYRDLWAEITDTYEKKANEQLIIALYGKDYQKIILRNQLSDIEAFKNNYVSIQNQINDNEGLIASYEEKTEYYEALKQQWSDISDAYENSMETQYAAMILGQDWESDVLNGRLDTLNHFKNQYISLQQQIADAAIAANNAIAASNEAVKNSQISSSVSVGNSGNSGSGSSASDSPTSNNLNSSSSGSSNSPALWRIVDYSSGATLKTGLKTAAEVSSWCSANGYTIVSENANTRIAAAKKQTAAATTTTAIQKAKAAATKHYASGTANAQKGLNLVGEAGTETYIDNGGNVSLVTQPALIPMEGGETVIKASETEKILSNMGNTVPSDSNKVLNKILSELPPFNEEEFRQRVMSITPSYSSMVQIPDMFTPNYDFEAVNRDNSVKVEIGDIHLHQVQKVDTLANEIIRELPNKVLQRLGKK